MITHSTWPRRVAILAGLICTGLALAILLADLVETGKPGLTHILAPGILTVTILAAKLRGAAWAQGRLGAAIGLALLVGLGTAQIVLLSVGRQSATADAEAAAVTAHNAARREAVQKLAEAADILGPCPKGREAERGVRCGLRDAMAAECGSGKGTRCEGRRYSVATYEAAITGYETRLAKMGAERIVNPQAERMAEVVAVLTGADKARVKHGLVLVEPFAATLFLELGAIVAFGFAFGGSVRTAPQGARTAKPNGSANGSDAHAAAPNGSETATVRPTVRETVRPTVRPVATVRPADGRRFTRAEAEADLVTMLALGQPIPSQETLRARWNVRSKATVSEWMAAWDAAGLTRREAHGKCKRVLAR